jgi:hypothetical protein
MRHWPLLVVDVGLLASIIWTASIIYAVAHFIF